MAHDLMRFETWMEGWLIAPDAGCSTHGFAYLEILEVTGVSSLTVKGDLTGMLTGDERFWIFAPPHVSAQTCAIRGTFTGSTFKPAKCDSRYLWAQYRYMPPMAGYEVNPGTPGIYGRQPGTNQTGTYHAWNRQYDPGTGRWTTPDPAMQLDNSFVYVRNFPAGATDPSGLVAPAVATAALGCLHGLSTTILTGLITRTSGLCEWATSLVAGCLAGVVTGPIILGGKYGMAMLKEALKQTGYFAGSFLAGMIAVELACSEDDASPHLPTNKHIGEWRPIRWNPPRYKWHDKNGNPTFHEGDSMDAPPPPSADEDAASKASKKGAAKPTDPEPQCCLDAIQSHAGYMHCKELKLQEYSNCRDNKSFWQIQNARAAECFASYNSAMERTCNPKWDTYLKQAKDCKQATGQVPKSPYRDPGLPN